MSISTERDCRRCGLTKDADEFPRGTSQYTCKSCMSEAARLYRQNLSPEKRAEQSFRKNLWKRYRLRPEQYYVLLEKGCEVCGTTENLCIDYDHTCCPGVNTCGQCIRGVLCSRHNQGEGYFKTVEEITALLAYRLKFEKDEKN